MYAHIDGNRAVGVGVYLSHMLFDNRGEVRIPVFQGFLENAHNALRVYRTAAGCAAAYDVLQFTFTNTEPVHFVP